MDNKKIIGVVGGVGPYAGIDLVRKIFDKTNAEKDQDHLPVVLFSFPEDIVDRSLFLLGETNINPANNVFEIIKKMEKIGVCVVGIPCNTMHAPEIYDIIIEKLEESNSKIKLIHMIHEVAKFIKQNHPQTKNVGLLCTLGTYKSKIYSKILEPEGFNVIVPDEKIQKYSVHDAIFSTEYGIKSHSNPVTEIAKRKLMETVDYLQNQGAEAVILGCTEIPLALDSQEKSKVEFIDPTIVLAISLIRETYPEKLI